MNYAGNIGYEIRYSKCRRGYGTKLLAMALPYCMDVLGLMLVLVSCDDNIGSSKIIERNGGSLEDIKPNALSRGTVLIRRY